MVVLNEQSDGARRRSKGKAREGVKKRREDNGSLLAPLCWGLSSGTVFLLKTVRHAAKTCRSVQVRGLTARAMIYLVVQLSSEEEYPGLGC